MTYYTTTSSPIGDLLLTSEGGALTGLRMSPFDLPGERHRDDHRFENVTDQLASYFAGALRHPFDVEIELKGTAFQRGVWETLRDIPYGETISYGEVSRRIMNPKAVRAVGQAVGANPIAVIVPCHRVIGADGTLTGYGGGLDRKTRLLALEGWPRRDRGGSSGSRARSSRSRTPAPPE